MLEHLQKQVSEQSLQTALIIDDAFDPPRGADIGDTGEAYLELLDDAGLSATALVLGRESLERDEFLELIEDDATAQVLHESRDRLPKAAADELFKSYDDDAELKRGRLKPISKMLSSAGLDVQECGSKAPNADASAEIIFVDLYFSEGLTPEEAADDAASKIEHYLPKRGAVDGEVPLVVLISSQPLELERVFERFRENAGLAGSRFAFLKKEVFKKNPNEAAFRLFELVKTNSASKTFEQFTRRIDAAAMQATKRFVRKLRTFELSDYADLSTLVAEPDGIALSQYLLELYALSWASFAESEPDTVVALRDLEALGLDVESYPPNAFVPSPSVLELYESALYRPGSALDPLDEFDNFGLGDVLVKAGEGDAPPEVDLVIVQDCDMQRKNRVHAAFLLPGDLKDPETARAQRDRFPIRIDGQAYSVSWQTKGWRAIRREDFPDEVMKKGLRRVLRLRSPWAANRQLEFFRHLSRPASIAAPHQFDPATVEVLLLGKGKKAVLIRESAGKPDAYILHAGTPSNPVTRLVLSQSCATSIREKLLEATADEERFDDDIRLWSDELLASPEALNALSYHLEVKNGEKVKQEFDKTVSVLLASKKPYTDGGSTNNERLMINVALASDDNEQGQAGNSARST